MIKPRIHGLPAMALSSALLLTTGCKSTSEPPAAPVTPEQLSQMRSTFRHEDPDARVGVVVQVLPGSHLASVGDVPLKDFTEGDIISFVDSSGKILAMGKVETIKTDSLIVRYDVSPSGRDPVVGDAAVRAIH